MTQRCRRTILLLALTCQGLVACRQEGGDRILLEASVRLETRAAHAVRDGERLFLRAGSPLELVYRFEPGAGFEPPRADLVVAARWVEPGGREVWTMDHRPPRPTRSWRPGQVVEYLDLLPLPAAPAGVPLTLRVGLYDPDRPEERWSLVSSEGRESTEWPLAEIVLQDDPEVQWREGWRPPEGSADGARSWRWMADRASVRLPNPGRSGFVSLLGSTRPDCFEAPPRLTSSVGGESVDSWLLEEDALSLALPISPALPGDGPWLDLELALDRTFQPDECDGGGDRRTLGLRLEELRFTAVRPTDGWYLPEHHAGASWRWTGPEARAELILPAGPGLLLLSGRVPRTGLERAPRVEIRLDGELLDSFLVEGDLIDRAIPLEPAGEGEHRAELVLTTDRTLPPRPGIDGRELGLQVDLLEVVGLRRAGTGTGPYVR